MALAVLPATGLKAKAETLLARHASLEAYVEQGCAETVAVELRAPDAAAFESDQQSLQAMLRDVKLLVSFFCPSVRQFELTGTAAGTPVYAETLVVEPSGGGTEMAAPTAGLTAQGAVAQALPAAASGFGVKLARGVPIVAGDRSALTEEEAAAASRLFDLVELGLDPGSVEDRPLCWALNHLPAAEQARYIKTDADALDAPSQTFVSDRFVAWSGANEFEEAASREAFLAEAAPRLLSRAVPLPLDVIAVREMELPPYDMARSGFPLGIADLEGQGITFDTLYSYLGITNVPRLSCPAETFGFAPPAVALPGLWATDPASANALVERLPERKVYLAFTLRLERMPLARVVDSYAPSNRTPVWSDLVSLALYEDPGLERLIAELPIRRAATPVVLSGIPETLPNPGPTELTDETLALVILRDHGDVLSPEAWRTLMLQQAEADAAYHRREWSRDVGLSLQQGTSEDYAADHVPFFPAGFTAGFTARFTPEMITAFKDWATARAAALPEHMTLRASMTRQGDAPPELTLPIAAERGSEAPVAPLVAEGYSAGQILRADADTMRVGSRFDATLVAGPERGRVPLLLLPNVASAYLPEMSAAEATQALGDGSWIRFADIVVEPGQSRLVEVDADTEALVLPVAPVQLRVYDGGEVLWEKHYDVEALDPERLEAPTPEVAPPSLPSLPLSTEAMDLLTVRHLPEAVSRDDYVAMLLARWDYEASVPPDKGEPVWGRFFVPGKPVPTDAQVEELLPRFEEWTKARAAALPPSITLTTGPVRVTAGEPVPVFVGGLYHLRGSDGSYERSVISTCKSQLSSRPALEPGCEYLQAVLDATPAIYPLGLGYAPAGPRIRCLSAVPTGSSYAYCQSRIGRFGTPNGIEPDPRFRDVLVYDKEVFFPGSASDAAALNARSLALAVEITVEEAELSDAALPVPIDEALARYAAFSEALGVDGPRPSDAPPTSTVFVFDAAVQSARLVDWKTGEPVLDLELRDARLPDLDALEIPQTGAEAATEPYGPDIIGLRLGMSLEEAEAIIRAHMPVGRVLVRDRALQPEAISGDFGKFSSSRIYVAEDESELIALYDEPPAAAGIVVAITRQINFPQGQMTAAAALTQMRGKYGEEDWSGRYGIGWGEGLRETTFNDGLHHQCMPSTGNRAARDFQEADGSPSDWRPNSGHSIPDLTLNSYPTGRVCGAILAMEFDAKNSASAADRLVLHLLDPNRYLALHEESRRQVETGEASFGVTADGPEIKL